MKNITIAVGLLLLGIIMCYNHPITSSQKKIISNKEEEISEESENKKTEPSDWFYTQRAYPFEEIPVEKYFDAIKRKKKLR